jgi:hypothetical protein
MWHSSFAKTGRICLATLRSLTIIGVQMTISDVFEPHHQPARSIYNALQSEQSKRKGRTVAEWTTAELNQVHFEAVRQAHEHGLRAPTLAEVMVAERCARGHIDYGAKWAYGVVESMRNRKGAAGDSLREAAARPPG